MEQWQWTCLILCAYGLFKEFRPSEPFLTAYLVDYKSISQNKLIHVAYPVWTYTYLGTLAIVFLVTDFLRYRIVVILEGFAYVGTWIILTWGQDLTSVIFVEILYGIVCSTEVAYYTYIYAKVDREKYKKVTSYTFSALFLGRFVSSLAAQLLVTFDLLDYHELNYLSLASVSVALAFALCLPKVGQSIYFHRDEDHVKGHKKVTILRRIQKAGPVLWTDFKSAYRTPYILKWSIWWAVATAGHLQIMNYIQALWEHIRQETQENPDSESFNGAVEAVHTLLSAILAFAVGFVKIPWIKWGELFLCVMSFLQGGSLILMSTTKSLNVAYAAYVIFRTLYQVMITVASSEVSQGISTDSHGLIFGLNTFLALVIQTLLTVVLADEAGLALNEPTQFFVYGTYFCVLGGVFAVVFLFILCKSCWFSSSNESKSQSDLNNDNKQEETVES